MSITFDCYIIPAIASLIYVLLSVPPGRQILNDWVPHYYYNVFIKAVILLTVLFVICRVVEKFM